MALTTFGKDGVTVGEVTPEYLERVQAAEASQVKKVATAQSILSRISPASDIFVEEKQITLGDETMTVFIKKLSYAECSRVDAKKMRRGPNKKVEMDQEYAATTGMAWQIFSCVVTNVNEGQVDEDGQKKPAKWEPLFTMEQIAGENGFMNVGDPKGKELFYQLLQAIWEVSPELSPFAQAAAVNSTGMT